MNILLVALLLRICLVATSLTTGRKLAIPGILQMTYRPIGDLLSRCCSPDCAIVLITDGTIQQDTIFKATHSWDASRGLGIFEIRSQVDFKNVTDNLMSQLIIAARKLRRTTDQILVIVASAELFFMKSFAELSVSKRLLAWDTRLLAVTKLSFQSLGFLLRSFWTFSMMNAMLLNVEDHLSGLRCSIYTHMPYTPIGAQVIRLATWSPKRGLVFTPQHRGFPPKFANFYGSTVNVTAQPFPPSWIETPSTKNSSQTIYSGTDYFLLEAVAFSLNFTIYVLPTADWTEVAQRVEVRQSFMATVFHNVLPKRLERYDFSYVYEYGSLDFSFSKPQVKPQWQSLYYPLSDNVWISTLVTLLFMPTAVLLVRWSVRTWAKDYQLEMGKALQLLIGTLLGQSLPDRQFKTHSGRMVLATWLIFSFILSSAYRGNLIAYLTLPKYPSRPEALKELVKVANRITMPPYGSEFKDFFGKSDSPVFTALAKLMHIVPSVLEGQKQAIGKKQAHLDTRRYQQLQIAQHFTRADGSTPLYIGQESIIPGQSAWPIPHDAPYREVLNRVLMAVIEAGLYEKWSRDLIRQTQSESRERLLQELKNETERGGSTLTQNSGRSNTEGGSAGSTIMALTLTHMQGPLFLLLLGLVLGLIAFVFEVCSSNTEK